MSWFGGFKKKLQSVMVSKAAGEWAVTAMGCMVYADGAVEQEELDRARAVVASNPVIKNSLGEAEGAALFDQVVTAIGTEPRSMLASYMRKLEELAGKVKSEEDRNFALGTVLAIATADGQLELPEYQMLVNFKSQLGATVELPSPAEISSWG